MQATVQEQKAVITADRAPHLVHLLLQQLLLLQREVLGIAGEASCGLHADPGEQLLLQEAARAYRIAPPAVLPPYSDQSSKSRRTITNLIRHALR
jgi:hypothetical protein